MDLNRPAPPLLSRILLALSALLLVGVVYLFASRALEEAPQPPPAPLRQAKNFDPRADISKNPSFTTLEDRGAAIPDMPIGRANPFVSLAKPAETTIQGAPTTTLPTKTVKGTDIQIVPVAPPVNLATSTEL